MPPSPDSAQVLFAISKFPHLLIELTVEDGQYRKRRKQLISQSAVTYVYTASRELGAYNWINYYRRLA